MPEAARFFAPQAWVGGSWAPDVLLVAGADGRWAEVCIHCDPADRRGAEVLQGPVLPGVVDAHSHAFQRAMAGLAERSAAGHDDFWSWRDRMYDVALRITPAQLEAIAGFLYAELLRAGYTHVCEFQYLHNDETGRAYADPLEMSLALVRAAERTGIGLTLLPTLYMRAGFGGQPLRADQRRFASTPASVLRIAEAVRARRLANVTAGVALHSLRAVDEGALRETAQAARAAGLPVHIHVAEQQREVDECLQQHRRRPVGWLLDAVTLDARWSLVHATHATPEELRAVQRTGAAVVLCPSTEANLGDGVFDLPAWLAAGGRWSIGSDSHVTRSWREELRLLELGQRLALRQRNVAAQAGRREDSAGVLFAGAVGGGTAAAGVPLAGLAPGERADFCVLAADEPALAGVPPDHLLDAAIFSSPELPMTQVAVAGRLLAPALDRDGYRRAMESLWAP